MGNMLSKPLVANTDLTSSDSELSATTPPLRSIVLDVLSMHLRPALLM